MEREDELIVIELVTSCQRRHTCQVICNLHVHKIFFFLLLVCITYVYSALDDIHFDNSLSLVHHTANYSASDQGIG